MDVLFIVLLAMTVEARTFCEKTTAPLEMGEWKNHLKHLDSTAVENPATSMSEGQLYVYENNFPNNTIKYIYVDNLAVKTCGASATVKSGGIGSSSVLIVLTARSNHEIRSVVDIWGDSITADTKTDKTRRPNHSQAETMKSMNLFNHIRAVSHNKPNKRIYV